MIVDRKVYAREYRKKIKEIKDSGQVFKPYHTDETKGVCHKTATQYIQKMNNIHKKLIYTDLTPECKQALYLVLTNYKPTPECYKIIKKELTYLNIFFVNLMKMLYKNNNSLKSNLIPYMTLTSYIDKKNYKKINYLINLETQQINKDYIDEKNNNAIKAGDEGKYITDFTPETIIVNMDKLDDTEKVIYGIYMLQRARRLEYGAMFIIDNEEYDTDIKNNYLVINPLDGEPEYFYFNNYKTQKTYGGQVIAINESLKPYIKNYITQNNLKSGDKFLRYNEGYMSSIIKNIFKKVYGEDITLNYIRRSHATHINSLNISNNERLKLVLEMGHSPNESLLYRKII
jgi:hypothetical protein